MFKRFGENIAFINENSAFVFDNAPSLNFYEKQYVAKTFSEYGKTVSEKNFISFFSNILDYYQENLFLQHFFNPFLACSLFNYQRGLQHILDLKSIRYPILNDYNQISPLVVALKLEYLNLAEIILETLMANH